MNVKTAAAVVFFIASLLPSAGTSAQEVFEQPVDPRDTLRELDDQVLAKQKALFAARLRGNPEEIRKAEEEFAEIQKKRKETVRAIERLR